MMLLRPEYAWLFAAVPLAGLGLGLKWKRRRRLAALIATHRRAGRLVRDGCFLAGLALLALAAAGPGIGQGPAAADGPGRLVVALDCSKSMWARDVAPDRLTAAKRLVRDVLAGLPDVPTGLVIFAGKARLACPVTGDRAGLLLFLDAASPKAVPTGGTSLTAALEAGRLALVGGDFGAVLLVSDGEETVAAADAARKSGPPVIAVAVGGTQPVTVPDGQGGILRDGKGRPVQVGADATALAALANASGGRAFRLSPDAAWPAPGVAATLEKLLVRPAVGQAVTTRPADRTLPCLALGLALFAVDLLAFPLGRNTAAALLALAVLVSSATPARAATSAATAVDRGLAALDAGRFDEAREHFLAARARNPDAPVILFDLGTACYRLGRYDQALAAFDRTARTSTGTLRARALYNQGNAAYRLGRIDQAAALYRAALAVDPNDTDARANLDFLASRPQPASGPPPAPPAPDGAAPPGKTTAPAVSGEATKPGQAPVAQGQDDGTGQDADKPTSPASGPDALAGPADRSGPDAAAVPLAAREGMAGGLKRAQPDERPGTAVMEKVPDLPGLPLPTPVYGRPTVEKDW